MSPKMSIKYCIWPFLNQSKLIENGEKIEYLMASLTNRKDLNDILEILLRHTFVHNDFNTVTSPCKVGRFCSVFSM